MDSEPDMAEKEERDVKALLDEDKPLSLKRAEMVEQLRTAYNIWVRFVPMVGGNAA